MFKDDNIIKVSGQNVLSVYLLNLLCRDQNIRYLPIILYWVGLHEINMK